MKKRNIIHFHAESWDGRMLGLLGHPALRDATPNIDRIAGEGIIFENAYSSHPICCPSRANMWGGKYTHNCESWNNNKGLEKGMWNFLDHIRATHTFKNLGKLDYLSGGHSIQNRVADWLACSGVEKPVFDEDHSQLFTVADDENVRCHEGDWQYIDQAVTFLEEQKDADKPFFITISTGLVHPHFHTNRYWLEKIPEDLVDIPAMDNTDHPCVQYNRTAKAWQSGFEDHTVRQVRRIYLAMCAEADALVGTLYEAMQRLGLGDDTYFVFTSDHGEMALEHQDWYKMTFYEASVRVPMIMTGPGIDAGQCRKEIVSLIDICPTFMDMAGIPVREGLDGESLLPFVTGQTGNIRNWAYATYTGINLNTTGYMLRKDNWKYIAYVGYPPQLFDLTADPGELHNLATERTDVVERLDKELRTIVDYEQTHQDVMAHNKEAFRQWRRQAKRGMFRDSSYGLRDNPSSDYMTLMDNTFTGYNEEDEKKVDQWLNT